MAVFLLLLALQVNAQTLLPLEKPLRGIIAPGATFSYYTDISPAEIGSSQFVTVSILLTANIGFYKIQLKYGSGAIFDDTRPGSTAWSQVFQISSERTAGDISGRWYITVSSCSGCTNVTATSTYEITANVHNFTAERKITIDSSIPETAYTIGNSWALWYFDVLNTSPTVFQVKVNKTSSVGFGQVYLGRDYIPTTSSFTYAAPNGASNNFYISSTLFGTQVTQVGFNSLGRWYLGFIGCQTCTDTYGYTVAAFDVTVTSRPWDTQFDLNGGSKYGTLAFDQWDIYYIDLPGDYQHFVTITLRNTTDLSYFKVYTRKSEIPTSSTYTSMVPASTTYSGSITITILPQSIDLGGRWYIGVRFCKACNSVNVPWLGSYEIQAVVSQVSKMEDEFDKVLSAEPLENKALNPEAV